MGLWCRAPTALYGDARLSADDADNNEGNLGIGYRQMTGGDLILGGHGWIDRRKTERGSQFNQATIGIEAMGQDVDVRANAYFPLSDANTVTIPNRGRTSPYLSGTSVLYDTDGTIVEKPQGGFDIELGYRLPVFEDHIDSVRAYAGVYRFAASGTDTVEGGRVRIAADVTPWLQIGSRYQYDHERGSQGFIEATFRLPGKASFRKEGLHARLDESPERDIDIVTSSKVTDPGIGKTVINPETGSTQRIIHVDNTSATTGDGSADSPYATLKAAEAALQPYDVVYVHRGDGATTGQDQGIIIDKPGVKLIGSGVDLVLSGNNVTGAAHGTTTQNVVIAAATTAPVITNNQAGGDGIDITADKGEISGLVIDGAQRNGIRVTADGAGAQYGSIAINNTVTKNNVDQGLYIYAVNGGRFQDVMLTGNTSSNNFGAAAARGFHVEADGIGSHIDHITINDSSATANNRQGFAVIARSGGLIDNIDMNNLSSTGNTGGNGIGVYVQSTGSGSVISNVSMDDIRTSTNGAVAGVLLQITTGGTLTSSRLSNVTSTGNTGSGINVQNLTGSTVGAISLQNITVSGNTQGIYLQNSGASQYDSVDIQNVTASGNTSGALRIDSASSSAYRTVLASGITATNNLTGNGRGVYVSLTTGGDIGTFDLSHVIATGNASEGVRIQADGSGSVLTDATVSDLTLDTNNSNGIQFLASNSGRMETINADHIASTNNAGPGVWVYTTTGGQIAAASFEDIIASNNVSGGFRFQADGAGSVISSGTAKRVTANNNTGTSGRGVLVYALASGELTSIALENIYASGNAQAGLYIVGQTGGILASSVKSSTSTGNTTNGVYVDDDTTGAFTADLGGGVLGSAGDNRIYGNTGTEARVDLDGGQLKAENNWWGVNTGLAGGEVTLDAGGNTIDAVPFLTSDPGI